VNIVQESGIGEITIEEEGMRISVRSTPDLPAGGAGPAASLGISEPDLPAVTLGVGGALMRVESPMVGTFYRASSPDAPPFVSVGDVVAPGQTLCILEAMKLMNEVKADVEGVVRAIHVENAQAVEFGQLLFELEPFAGRPAL
jgi:oxaloacetate decarboxylase alpha subunit